MDNNNKFQTTKKDSSSQTIPNNEPSNTEPEEELTLSTSSDLTQGNIWKHIFRIAIPTMLGQIFNVLYNWIDTFWGGRISTEALAAFSMTFPVFLVAIALAQCFAAGGMVLVSNSLGAKKLHDAKHYYHQTILCSLFSSIFILVFILTLGKHILMLLGAQGEVLKYSLDYIHVLAFGLPFMIMFFSINIGLTSQGNTRFMRNILIMNTLINIGLDPLFLYGFKLGGIQIIPAMGIKGIALATVLVQVLGAVIAWYKVQKDPIMKWKPKTSIIPLPTVTKQILHLGSPTFLQISMAAFGLAMVNFFLARLSAGTPVGNGIAVAAYGVGLRIEQLALVPTFGIGMALSALAGQNNGAKQYLRVRESYYKVMLSAIVLWLGTMLPVVLFSNHITRLFTSDEQTIQVTYYYLHFAFIAFMAYQLMGSSSNLLQSMKKPRFSLIFLTTRQLVFPWLFIPLFAYKLGWGIYGIFTSVVLSAWIAAIILCIKANYELHKLVKQSPDPDPIAPDNNTEKDS